MYSSAIFFLATCCVINASVITVNVFDDDLKNAVESEDSFSLSSCNPQECDQRCRRLKFRGGVCVNGRCKCDNFRTSEDFAALIEEFNSLGKCYPQECEQRCRRLKFPGGACVNGRCKCDNFRASEDFASIIEEYNSLRNCCPRECYQKCRKMNYPKGFCVNGECKCLKPREAEDDLQQSLEESEDHSSLNSCNPQECDQRCRRLKFPGGVCVHGRCKCDKSRASEDLASLIEEFNSLKKCYPQECEQRCRRLKFPGGACVNGRCKCDNFRTSEDIYSHPEDLMSTTNCVSQDCNERCQRLGFAGGNCIKDSCVCKKTKITEVFDLENWTSKTCEDSLCSDWCRSHGFLGGVCVRDICRCYNLINTEDDITESVETLSASVDFSRRSVCFPKTCNRLCKLRRFKDGTCVNGFCKCTKKEDPAHTTPASVPKEPNMADTAADNDFEESNLILNEGEIEDNIVEHERVTRDKCYQYKCNDSCLRVGYAGGLCKKNKCKCY